MMFDRQIIFNKSCRHWYASFGSGRFEQRGKVAQNLFIYKALVNAPPVINDITTIRAPMLLKPEALLSTLLSAFAVDSFDDSMEDEYCTGELSLDWALLLLLLFCLPSLDFCFGVASSLEPETFRNP